MHDGFPGRGVPVVRRCSLYRYVCAWSRAPNCFVFNGWGVAVEGRIRVKNKKLSFFQELTARESTCGQSLCTGIYCCLDGSFDCGRPDI